MQITLNEARRVAMMYQSEQKERVDRDKIEPESVPELNLSDDVNLVQAVTNEVRELPDVRAERVRELKALVESGNYHVESKAVAEAIVKRAIADKLR
ncbi:MAG: flagellar biosynthesis anti-sigma factor FlgM [Fimbriimonadia bacterium]|nr:flagellar biosynthesis anti-sigma factor FlgM [Fimbriimonadia bacterium]